MKALTLTLLILAGGAADAAYTVSKQAYYCSASCRYDIADVVVVRDPAITVKSGEEAFPRGAAQVAIDTACTNSCGRMKLVSTRPRRYETWDNCRISSCACEFHTWKAKHSNDTINGQTVFYEVQNTRRVREVECTLPTYR